MGTVQTERRDIDADSLTKWVLERVNPMRQRCKQVTHYLIHCNSSFVSVSTIQRLSEPEYTKNFEVFSKKETSQQRCVSMSADARSVTDDLFSGVVLFDIRDRILLNQLHAKFCE